LSPKKELAFQFRATIERVHFGLALGNEHVHPEIIESIISNQIIFAIQRDRKTADKLQKNVLNYKQILDYIKRDWKLSTKRITVQTLLRLSSLSEEQTNKISEKELQDILSYLNASTDNPFIQAAIAKLQLRRLHADPLITELFSTMTSYLFLYQSGMDCRGLLVLEKPWARQINIFNGYFATAIVKPNVTNWIEYFVKTVCEQLEEVYQTISQQQQKHHEEKIGNLNERQKVIMTLLDDPQAIITNRTIQKIFHISAITASRDLAKLTMLGLLIQQGKGRSVRYTRI